MLPSPPVLPKANNRHVSVPATALFSQSFFNFAPHHCTFKVTADETKRSVLIDIMPCMLMKRLITQLVVLNNCKTTIVLLKSASKFRV